MSLFAYLNGSDHAHEVRLGQFGLTTRADGSSGFGNIVFDDPECDLDVRGWMHCVVKETDCTTAPVIFAGYVADRRYSRSGPESRYADGAARFIDTTLVDLNTLMHFQAMFVAEANRPAETEEDRVNWLLASGYMQGVIDDGKSNPTTRMLEAEDYRQQYPDDLLSSLVNTWVFFVYLTQPDGEPALYFNPASSSTGTSTLSISNDLSDISLDANGNVTGTCLPSSIDAEMTMDPSEVYARIGLYWVGGRTIESDPTTLATFFTPSGLGYRSLPYTTDRVKSEATAEAYVARMLARDSTENETITDTIIVPSSQVGLIQAGNRIDTKYLHFGDSDFVSRRISGLEVKQLPGRRDFYLLTLEMNAKGSDAIGGGGGSPGDFPHPPPTTVTPDYDETICNTVIEDTNRTADSGAFGSMNPGEDWYYEFSNPIHDPTGSTHELRVLAYNTPTPTPLLVSRDDPPEQLGSYGAWSTMPTLSGTFSIPTGGSVIAGQAFDFRANVNNYSATPAVDECWNVKLWRNRTAAPPDVDTPPSPGQPVGPETVTMTGPDGTTAFAFADGSLQVFVDNTNQTGAITAQDGAAGTFTLGFSPTPTEVVTVFYQGR